MATIGGIKVMVYRLLHKETGSYSSGGFPTLTAIPGLQLLEDKIFRGDERLSCNVRVQ
jgi:hypothetical protein